MELGRQKRVNVSTIKVEEPKIKVGRQEKTKGSLDEIFDKNVRPYIDIIDSMRKYGLEQDLELPNVVVVGDQSSGKSSIIEIISGIQLPRGTGIVTRCPLELQLKKVENQPWKSTISYVNCDKNEIKKDISDPELLENCISKAQNDLCRSKKGVSKELITLKIESPAENAPDLTLIDLPGIARTAIEDQPLDICEQIKKIIMNHVKQENTVILCVISGDLDIAVNESVNIARMVDPAGLRTIGVITKPDIADVDHKREVLKMMDNKKIDLKKGFNLVKCRSSDQLKNKVPLSEFLRNEMDYYENDEIYKDAKKSQVGAINLAKKITMELVNVIKTSLPKLRTNIEDLLEIAKEKLSQMPPSVPQDDKEKRSYIFNIASDLNVKLNRFLIFGKVFRNQNCYNDYRVNFKRFLTSLQIMMAEAFKKEFSFGNLKEEIENHRGKEISGFISYDLFENVVRKHISLYQEKAKDTQLNIGTLIKEKLDKLFEESFNFLPLVEKDLKRILNLEFEKIMTITEERIDFIFKQEEVVFTMDEVLDKIRKETDEKIVQSLFSNVVPSSIEDLHTTENNAKRMSEHIKSYLKIVHTRLCDSVPMAIQQCLMFQLHDNLRNHILQYASGDDIFAKIKESPQEYEERIDLMDKIERLKKGKKELDNI